MATPQARQKAITAELPTKSAKIRALNEAGYSRTEIANFLNISYQHVRNVLVHDARAKGGIADPQAAPEAELRPMKLRIGPEGRVVIPAAFRERLGLKENDVLLAIYENDSIQLMTMPAAVRRAQALVRQFVPKDVSL